jgi:aspartyl-tRNA(Asn)/glutamyl-tRNA(Gln) amidotransferase subunit A
MMGTYVLSSGYYDAYYKKAQTVRTKIINEFDDVFKNVDILLGPTAPNTAFKLGSNTKDPLKMYLTDIMTVVANLTGMPAISLPCGLDASGLPIGLQLMAQRGQDSQLLAVASGFEEALNA